MEIESKLSTWGDSPEERWAYLERCVALVWESHNTDRANEQIESRDKPAGRRYVLEDSSVVDLSSFFCALGEAINGPDGYFGLSIQGLDDCLYGGFGAKAPFELVVNDLSQLETTLDSSVLYDWCCAAIHNGRYLDEDGLDWLTNERDQAVRGEVTMFLLLNNVLSRHGVVFVEQQ